MIIQNSLKIIIFSIFLINGCGGGSSTSNNSIYYVYDISNKTKNHKSNYNNGFFENIFKKTDSKYIEFTTTNMADIKIGDSLIFKDSYKQNHTYNLVSKFSKKGAIYYKGESSNGYFDMSLTNINTFNGSFFTGEKAFSFISQKVNGVNYGVVYKNTPPTNLSHDLIKRPK